MESGNAPPPNAQPDSESRIEGVNEALEIINEKHAWVIAIFLLVSSPGMFNAWHIMASNFYAFTPPHWCKVDQLEKAGWTHQEIKNISKPRDSGDHSCSMVDWDYSLLAELGYGNATTFVSESSYPGEVTCSEFNYEESIPHSSTVSEWDLVCDNQFGKSHIQGSIAVGKLVGAFLFGLISDKYGRKVSFNLAACTYMLSGTFAALAPNFWAFIVFRFLIGIAGSGCYETGFTILAELLNKKRRAAFGCVYNIFYPIGYMVLPAISLRFPLWRHLQLAISLPMWIMLVHCWCLPESPRWLIMQGKHSRAWKIITKVDKSLVPENFKGGTISSQALEEGYRNERRPTARNKLIGGSLQMLLICSYNELLKRTLIVWFAWFGASLVYYILGLNAPNFEFDQYLYTFLTGIVEVPGYALPALVLMLLGRKWTTSILYFITGAVLILIMVIPKGKTELIFVMVLAGRFTDVAVFGMITVYTSEMFPTVVRNTAVGSCLAVSQFGSIFAPYIVNHLNKFGWYVPSTICGLVSLLSGLLVLMLYETRGCPLLDTVEEAVSKTKDQVSISNCCKCS